MSRPVIITCAITGAIHTPSMSPALPVTPDQIAASAIGAAKAGAAIVHLHSRHGDDGRPDQSVDGFASIIRQVSQGCEAIVNITTGGAPTMTVAERVQPAAHYRPELASLNMGSMNFGLFGMLKRFKDLTHDWERTYLGNRDIIFRNSFQDIGFILETLRDAGTRFEFECYDVGHLYNLAHFLDEGVVQGPLFVQTIFGLMGGIGAHSDDFEHMKRTADRLFGDQYRWSVLGAGRNQMPLARRSVALGGHVRVGLEDSIWAGPGELAVSNAQHVELARAIVEDAGCRVATPDEAREILALKGADKTGF